MAKLGQLNFKIDQFHIKHLERVKSVKDAKEANMSSKHVNNLRLSWDEESQLQENVKHFNLISNIFKNCVWKDMQVSVSQN